MMQIEKGETDVDYIKCFTSGVLIKVMLKNRQVSYGERRRYRVRKDKVCSAERRKWGVAGAQDREAGKIETGTETGIGTETGAETGTGTEAGRPLRHSTQTPLLPYSEVAEQLRLTR